MKMIHFTVVLDMVIRQQFVKHGTKLIYERTGVLGLTENTQMQCSHTNAIILTCQSKSVSRVGL